MRYFRETKRWERHVQEKIGTRQFPEQEKNDLSQLLSYELTASCTLGTQNSRLCTLRAHFISLIFILLFI